MNREIKFRIWSVDNKFFINAFTPSFGFAWAERMAGLANPEFDKHVIFQQFTGLRDKNGKDIYEGDIVNFRVKGYAHERYPEDITNAEVWYDAEEASFAFGCEDNEWMMIDGLDSLEIVGNIFENADLLKT